MKDEIYKDEGYKLMGAAFEVYNEHGYGMTKLESLRHSCALDRKSGALCFSE